jgi:LmbE family N-acetylglucosaminyl deacetylase
MHFLRFLCFAIMGHLCVMSPSLGQAANSPIHIIMIGAHPDDCDIDGGGTAALFASMGCSVKFLSLTNGDAGHQTMKGPALAKRRLEEAQEAARRLGVTYEVLDHHDGQLVPSLEIRLEVIRAIRNWHADVVISHRPNDYHPDHRYTGILVQDAAYMVAVPDIAPETPALQKNPLFLYFEDKFQRPNPFRPDICVDISSSFAKKISALDAHESQMYEWLPWIGHYLDQVPSGKSAKLQWLAETRGGKITPEARQSLDKWYGPASSQAEHAESFEICEYGLQPTEADIRHLFPMLVRH